MKTNLNPFMHNVPKWSDTLQKSYTKCSKIFKVCLTIFGRCVLKDQKKFRNASGYHRKHSLCSYYLDICFAFIFGKSWTKKNGLFHVL